MSSAPVVRLLVPVVVLESALIGLALGLGAAWSGSPVPVPMRPDVGEVLLGLAVSLPCVGAAFWFTSSAAQRVGWAQRIQRRVLDSIGPGLAAEDVMGLAAISLSAGLGEELLFRGVLQHELGLLASAVAFGLLHAVTPAYFVLALAMGLLLGALAEVSGGLMAPVIVHSVYDFAALLRLRAWARREADAGGGPPTGPRRSAPDDGREWRPQDRPKAGLGPWEERADGDDEDSPGQP